MQKQKGIIQVMFLTIIAMVVVIAGAYYYTVKKNSGSAIPVNTSVAPGYQTDYLQGAKNVTSIKSGADLNTASADLNGTDLSQIDSGLNGLSADSSSF